MLVSSFHVLLSDLAKEGMAHIQGDSLTSKNIIIKIPHWISGQLLFQLIPDRVKLKMEIEHHSQRQNSHATVALWVILVWWFNCVAYRVPTWSLRRIALTCLFWLILLMFFSFYHSSALYSRLISALNPVLVSPWILS